MICIRLCVLFLLAPLLSGCLEERPPTGYETASAIDAESTTRQCPDLKGSYDLSKVPLGRAITDQAPPETRGLPVLMTFKQGVTHLEAWWVVPIGPLREWADKERLKNPVRYSRWHERVLQYPGPMARMEDIEATRGETAKLGPQAGPFYAGIVSYACMEGWMRIREQPGYQGTPRDPGAEGFGETEIWLGRGVDGALLVKTVHYNLKPFRVWGDAATTIRTSSSATWSKVQPAEFAEAIPLEKDDLPAPLPREHYLSCDQRINRLAELTNRIQESAPLGIFLVGSTVPANDPTLSQEDCSGKGRFLELVFVAHDPDQLQQLNQQIMSDPDVEEVKVLPGPTDVSASVRLNITLR